MKKLLSVLLAFMILMSTFMGLGFSVSAENADVLKVTIGDTTTDVKVGDTFRYTMTLTDVEILNCHAKVNYDSDFVAADITEDSEKLKECFPIINSSVMINNDIEDVVWFDCSRTSKYYFEGEQALVTIEFTALAAGQTRIWTDIIEMAKTITTFYVMGSATGSVVVEPFVSDEFITYEATEDPTDEPTEEPTEDPTDEPTQDPTVAPTKPVKVENIVATPESSTAVLTWDAVDGATKYWIYKNKNGSYVAYSSATATNAVVGGLEGNTTYQVKVVAVLSDGSMQKLADADVVEFTTKAPVVVNDVETAIDVTSVKLSWNAAEGAQKYWIYKAFEENGPFYVYDATTELEYTVKRLQPDTTYYFKIVPAILSNGVLALGEKDAAEKITVTTASGDTIQTKIEELTSTTATISWPQLENAKKYWVMFSTQTKSTSDLSKWTTWAETTDTTYTFKWREPGVFYHFTVVALYTDEETGRDETVNYVAASARMPYSDSDIITFTPVDDDTVTLTWSQPTDVSKVWVSYIDASGKETVYTSTTESTVTINLKNYKDYKFALSGLDSTGNVGYITRFGGEAYHE